MAFTPFSAGQTLTAASLNTAFGWTPVSVAKSADQSVTNSTTLVNDSELFFTPAINTSWQVRWDLLYSATTAQDGKIGLTFPAGATCPWGYQGLDTSVAFSSIGFDSAGASGGFFNIGGTGAALTLVCRITATLTMGATAGSLRLQFAQAAALAATSMTIRQGSSMTYHRIA